MGRTFWGTLDTECWVEASIQGDRADHTADSGWRGGGATSCFLDTYWGTVRRREGKGAGAILVKTRGLHPP